MTDLAATPGPPAPPPPPAGPGTAIDSPRPEMMIGAANRGASVVIIAHRAGVLARVDRLLMMREGVVQMEGPREEVLERMRAAAPKGAGPAPAAGAPGQPTANVTRLADPSQTQRRAQ